MSMTPMEPPLARPSAIRRADFVLPEPAGPWRPMRALAASRVAGVKEKVFTWCSGVALLRGGGEAAGGGVGG
ncbi:hypothetical protein SCALM49S_04530 [Streptomyces californicus]